MNVQNGPQPVPGHQAYNVVHHQATAEAVMPQVQRTYGAPPRYSGPPQQVMVPMGHAGPYPHPMGAQSQQQQVIYHQGQPQNAPVPSGYPAYALPGNMVETPISHQRFAYPKNQPRPDVYENQQPHPVEYPVQQQQQSMPPRQLRPNPEFFRHTTQPHGPQGGNNGQYGQMHPPQVYGPQGVRQYPGPVFQGQPQYPQNEVFQQGQVGPPVINHGSFADSTSHHQQGQQHQMHPQAQQRPPYPQQPQMVMQQQYHVRPQGASYRMGNPNSQRMNFQQQPGLYNPSQSSHPQQAPVKTFPQHSNDQVHGQQKLTYQQRPQLRPVYQLNNSQFPGSRNPNPQSFQVQRYYQPGNFKSAPAVDNQNDPNAAPQQPKQQQQEQVQPQQQQEQQQEQESDKSENVQNESQEPAIKCVTSPSPEEHEQSEEASNQVPSCSSSESVTAPPCTSSSSEVIESSGKQFVDKVPVPWGWKRLILSDSVMYYSPSGVQFKSKQEVKAYLLKEGTCKCGLECPVNLDVIFDFDDSKQSEVIPLPLNTLQTAKYCAHKKDITALALFDKTPGFLNRIKHIHEPVVNTKKGRRKVGKKQTPFSGLKVAQMLEARESERQRINEIIQQQKQQYEASLAPLRSSLQPGTSKDADQASNPGDSIPEKVPAPRTERKSSNESTSGSSVQSVDSNNEEAVIKSSVISENKNLEIRRMSATEEGDKILEEAWTSPEKDDKGKTPLELVENIISNLERPPASDPAVKEPKESLEWEENKVKEQPPLPNPPQPQPQPHQQHQHVMGPQTSINQAMTSIQFQTAQSQQPVMQLVSTVTGPMLMPVNNQQGLLQIPVSNAGATARAATAIHPVPIMPMHPHPQQPQPQPPPLPQPPETKTNSKKKGKKKKVTSVPRTNPIPILMSPPGSVAQAPMQNVPQYVTINQQASAGGPNLITASQTPHGVAHILPAQPANLVLNQNGQVVNMGNQMMISNGTLVSLPMQTGVILNQMPDGTFVQVHNNPGVIAAQMPMIQTAGQPVLAAGGALNAPFFVNNGSQQANPGGQLIQGQPGAFIMTPQGLIQATPQTSPIPRSVAITSPIVLAANQASSIQKKSTTSSSSQRRISRASSSDSSVASEDQKRKVNEDDSEEEIDDPESIDEDEEDDEDEEEIEEDEEEEEEAKRTEEDSDDNDTSEDEVKEVKAVISKTSSSSRFRNSKTSIQSNQVDSSGLKATPPYSGDFHDHSKHDDSLVYSSVNNSLDNSGTSGSLNTSGSSSISRRRRKRNADELLKEDFVQTDEDQSLDESPESLESKKFSVGEIVWGPHRDISSWPGKVIAVQDSDEEDLSESKIRICWFGSKEETLVNNFLLKNLSDGLDAHHKERKRSRKGRKMNAGLERAIQEAMVDLDKGS